MRRYLNRRATVKFLVTFSLLFLLGSACSACSEPVYRDGTVLTQSKSEVVMYVSIRQTGLDPSHLLCLADALKRRFRDREKITILVFTSREAAMQWRLLLQEQTPRNSLLQSKLQAIYTFDSARKEDYIELIPYHDGNSVTSSFDTKFRRGSPNEIQCKLAISNRCILSIPNIKYPDKALIDAASGSVTLEASIAPGGTVVGVRVVESDGRADLGFRSASQRNLKLWRFQSSDHAIKFRISYRYRVIPAQEPFRRLAVDFNLPEELIITAQNPK